jgi:AAA domain/Bifunctional DNA primase/polymerase, N-terminal
VALHTDDPFLASPPLTHEKLRDIVTARRVALVKLGYEPIPIMSGRKRPAMSGWQNVRIALSHDEDAITPWADTYPGALSTGIRTRYTPGADIDIRDQDVADQVEQALLNMLPNGGTILKRTGLPPKRLIPLRCRKPFKKIAATFKADDVVHKVEVLGDGQQFVAEGIHEDTHLPYRWADNVCLLDVAHEHLPLVDEELAHRFVSEASEIMKRAGWTEVGAQGKPKINGKSDGKTNSKRPRSADNEPAGAEKRGSTIYGRTALKYECDKLAAMPKDSGRNNALNSAAFSVFQLVAGGEIDEERDQVAERLFAAAETCGLVAEDGAASVCATIESGAKAGRAQPRRAPDTNGGDRHGDQAGDQAGDQTADQDDELVITTAANLEMCGVDWLWPGRFARGKFGLVAGLPDMGKGQIAAFIAAAVTAAIELPCDEGNAPQGSAIWFNAEDGERDTVLPRLVAAGADPKHIHFVNGARISGEDKMFNLVTDLRLLRKEIERIGNVVLVIIDPVSAYLGVGKVDGRSATDVRGVLTPLKVLAEELHIAVIGIAHFNKKDDIKSALLRVSDSIAYVAAARHVYAVLDDPEDKNSKLFVKAKNNLARDTKALRYGIGVKKVGHDARLGVDIDAPYIVWHPQHVNISANEAMAAAGGHTAKREAREFLLERLEAGPVKAIDIIEEAKQEGIAKRTLDRAKKDLGIKSRKTPELCDGEWFWELPPKARARE